MNRSKKVGVISLFLVLQGCVLFGHHNRIGGELDYNFRTKSPGIGLRAEFSIESIDWNRPVEWVSVVPRGVYYAGRYQEFYLGSDVHVGLYHYHRWNAYALANLGFNGWLNHSDTLNRSNPQWANWAFEVGFGVNAKLRKCWYPFAELRLNAKWWDPSIQLGIMYTLKCDRRGAVPCSKIPKQPFEFFKEE